MIKLKVIFALLLMALISAVAQAQYLVFRLDDVNVTVAEFEGGCILVMSSPKLKYENEPQLKLPVAAPCDVMTKGASYNFAIDARGDSRSGNYLLRVVGNLKWIPENRAECSLDFADVIVDTKNKKLSLAPKHDYPRPTGWCPRSHTKTYWP